MRHRWEGRAALFRLYSALHFSQFLGNTANHIDVTLFFSVLVLSLLFLKKEGVFKKLRPLCLFSRLFALQFVLLFSQEKTSK